VLIYSGDWLSQRASLHRGEKLKSGGRVRRYHRRRSALEYAKMRVIFIKTKIYLFCIIISVTVIPNSIPSST
jgi:hypothetical protein